VSYVNHRIKDMRNRSRFEIVGDILQAANESSGSGGATRTKIMYKAYLSYAQMKGYLTALTEKDLLRYDLEKERFKITQKGLMFLDIYNQINNMIQLPTAPEQYQQLI
jgi:predicted transcriptional regulator